MKKKTIFKITLCAIFAAMAIALSFLHIPLFNIEITLYGIPLIVIGIIYGPVYGILSGFVCGFTEQLITYGISIESIFYMLAPIIWGGISGIISMILKLDNKLSDNRSTKVKVLLKYFIIITITAILANLTNTISLTVSYYIWSSKVLDEVFLYFITNVVTRLLSVIIHIIIYIPLVISITIGIKKYLNSR